MSKCRTQSCLRFPAPCPQGNPAPLRVFPLLLAAFCLALALWGCASGVRHTVGQSGFLGDYSQLKPGGPGMAALVYSNPDADTRKYRDIVIEPVVVVLKPDADRSVDTASLNDLAVRYHARLVDEISPVFAPARVVGPQTLRLRVAITDVIPSNRVRAMMSVLPVGMVVSEATRASTGEYPDVGQAESEMELLDAVTGERLYAAVDRRVGTKAVLRGTLDDAQDAIDLWAGKIAAGLAKVRVQR